MTDYDYKPLESDDFKGMLRLALWRSVERVEDWYMLVDSLTDEECEELMKYLIFSFGINDNKDINREVFH